MLNVATKKIPYPLPVINENLSIVCGHDVFSKFWMNVLVIMLVIYNTKDKYKITFNKHCGM
jgi:hypothetical protein